MKCPFCKTDINSSTVICPKCKAQIPKKKEKKERKKEC